MMTNTKVKPDNPFLILPACLVGANVDGKPNFEAIAWFNLCDYEPYMMSISSLKSHYTNDGIRTNKAFSVNIPSSDMAVVTDYCGTYSGREVDKSKVFDIFYGELKTAPMITECPISFECRLTQTIELVHNELFIGQIAGTYVADKCLTDGKPDVRKINPLLFGQGFASYWRVGNHVAKAFIIGKDYKPKQDRKSPSV